MKVELDALRAQHETDLASYKAKLAEIKAKTREIEAEIDVITSFKR
jgi:hypothetical protein